MRQFITSGSANETVPDKSIFREQFIEALEGEGDLNNDGYVTGSELGDFLETTVINYSREGQHPQYGKIRNRYLDKGDFVFVKPASSDSTSSSSSVGDSSGTMGTQIAGGSFETQSSGKGRLMVKSEPSNAEIYIDTIFSGTSPLNISIKPGIYTVEARKKDYKSESKRIRLFENQDLNLTLVLDKAGSSLFISSDPSGAEIQIDNAYSGQTPLELKGLHPGSRLSIKLKKEGYQDWQQSITIGNQDQNLSARLNKKSTAPEGMVLIPAGEFEMGSNDGDKDEKPVHRVYLNEFYLDQHEVTVDHYKECVSAGRCEIANTNYWSGKHQSEYDRYCNYDKSDRGQHPINCVDWKNAKAYCDYAGKRLPTEAEWEKAATWKNGRKYKYPSGKNSVSCADAVMVNSNNWKDWETKGGCDRVSTWSVGSKPEEINGTYDMAGNIWEWVADWYGSYSSGMQRNPMGPSSASYRVNRGGSWSSNASVLRGAIRFDVSPSRRSSNLGFRCALSPQ